MNQNLKNLAARGIDGLGHSSVQPWSAGPIFPAVIAKVERYSAYVRNIYTGVLIPLADRLETQWWELTLDGRTEQYATREDAETVAKALLADPVSRQYWARGRKPTAAERASEFMAESRDRREHVQYLEACERSIREGVAA